MYFVVFKFSTLGEQEQDTENRPAISVALGAGYTLPQPRRSWSLRAPGSVLAGLSVLYLCAALNRAPAWFRDHFKRMGLTLDSRGKAPSTSVKHR